MHGPYDLYRIRSLGDLSDQITANITPAVLEDWR
jgi:hypothetical protein